MSLPTQNNTQAAPVVLTIPTQKDSESEREHIVKIFPKKTIITFSIIQLCCAAIVAILQVSYITLFTSIFFLKKGLGAFCKLRKPVFSLSWTTHPPSSQCPKVRLSEVLNPKN